MECFCHEAKLETILSKLRLPLGLVYFRLNYANIFEKVKLLAKDLEPVILTESECLYFLRLKIFPVYSILLQMSKFMSLITVALQRVQ